MIDDVRASYPEAVAVLCDWGWPQSYRNVADWPDFRVIGLAEEHVPDLIRMATDPVLNTLPPDSNEVWAPFHACRALGQLGAVEGTGPMLQLLDDYPGDDFLHEEMPHVMAALGPGAIPEIADFVSDSGIDRFARIIAIECLEQIAKEHPASRDDCVQRLVSQLTKGAANDEGVNGFLISSLAELRAKEAIETIRAAFAADAVDLTVTGDLEDIEIEMEFRLFRETPQPHYGLGTSSGGAGARFGHGMDLGPNSAGNTDTVLNPFRNVGRNDPCPCGSGKKFKKCCLERA